jgi:hypothetical protein
VEITVWRNITVKGIFIDSVWGEVLVLGTVALFTFAIERTIHHLTSTV